MLNTNKKPINVGILEISAQNKAVLEFFFSGAGKSYFKEVSLDKASAYIIDYDSLGAKESWESTFEETKKPGIIISIKEVSLPSTIWLPKPLTVKALKEAGQSIKEIMLQQEALTVKEPPTNKETSPEPVVVAVEEVENKIIEKEDVVIAEDLDTANIMNEISDKTETNEEQETLQEFIDLVDQDVAEETSLETAQNQNEDIFSLDDVLADDIIELPTESISEIVVDDEKNITEKIIKEKATIEELKEDLAQGINQEENIQVDNLIIDEIVATPVENLLTEDASAESLNLEEATVLEEEKEFAVAEISASALSSGFATSTNFVDIDLSLERSDADLDESLSNAKEENAQLKSPVNKPEITTESKTEDSEVDSLLESLISGEGDSKNAGKRLADTIEDKAESDLLDFNLETAEALEDTEFPLADSTVIEDDGSSIELQSFNQEDSDLDSLEVEKGLSDKLLTTLTSLETTATADDVEIGNTLDSDDEKIKEPNKSAEEELQSLLEEIRQEADGTAIATSSTKKDGAARTRKKYAPTSAQERWKLTCGNNKDSVNLQKLCSFDSSNHVLAILIKSIKTAKNDKQMLRIKFKGIIVVVDPESDRIYCDQALSTDFYANTCYEPLAADKVKVHTLDASELRLYQNKIKMDDEHTHCTEAFIWTTSLLTSRGRLPKATNIKSKVGLTSWPNLTRVEPIPHMMQVAALLHKNTWNLLDISNQSGISKKYIVAFYNAALALDMVESNGVTTSNPSLDLKTGGNENRSLFSRFLKKITV